MKGKDPVGEAFNLIRKPPGKAEHYSALGKGPGSDSRRARHIK
ncbi:hypothetical protein [[Eubacterium] cellulosolvens]